MSGFWKSTRLWLRKRVIPWAGPLLAAWAIRLLSATIRFQVKDEAGLFLSQQHQPRIWAFWHNRILLLPAIYRKYRSHSPLVVMISRSRDGEMISDTAARFGIESARGSTSGQGASAFIKLARESIRSGKGVGVTPDGPRGPRYRVQEGVVRLSQITGLPVIPITYHLSDKWTMNSWDQFQIPKPFSRCEIIVSQEIASDTPNQAEAIAVAMGE